MQAKSKNLEWVLKASSYVYESRLHDQLQIKSRFYEIMIMFCYLFDSSLTIYEEFWGG